ncbi:CLUMA_CG000839, isoform A [Clunio marinus]|uniref:Copper transport protein n=1 Tax=Clunio marinus TaxID=568069 RepID=A0A1J1HKL6_9DIPT|nr:CLUMA_CG000839, isoform A [Clunio marinus]
MDHGDHDHGDGHGDDADGTVCTMNMSLHWGTCEFILVKSWQANTLPKFIGAAIGIFLLAVVYEGLKYYREMLLIESERKKQIVQKNSNGEVKVTTKQLTIREQILNVPHAVQTFLHFGQVFISYILMLIVMLCNNWLIIAICLGAGIGYLIFGWLRKIQYRDINECCY